MMLRYISSLCLVFVLYVNAKQCPGGSHQCPEGATCCKLPDTSYGCCPLPDATCCEDHMHCCPQGYTCNGDSCVMQEPNVTHQPIIKKEEVPCGDSNYTCPSITACCLSDVGEYNGCCMEPDAVCCGGGYFCCPTNEDCEKAEKEKKNCYDRRYQSQAGPLRVVHQVKFDEVEDDAENEIYQGASIICPDGTSECPGGCTCCQLPQGSWGCCPFPDATCCEDHLHCCPNEMVCSGSSTTCHRSDFTMPSFKTLIAGKSAGNRN